MDRATPVTLPALRDSRFSMDSDSSSASNRQQLEDAKRIANRIRCGQVSEDTCTDMIQRVRAQFLHPTRGHLPLLHPSAVPSVLRPSQPQITKFSKGVRVHRRLCREENQDTAAVHGESHMPLLTDTAATHLAASHPGSLQTAHSLSRPTRMPLFSPRRKFSIPSSCLTRLSDLGSDLMLYELQSSAEQILRFLEIESAARQSIHATEGWDREVTYEMMLVHYVTSVLKPEMEDLLSEERFARGVILLDEETLRYELCSESGLAKTIKKYEEAIHIKTVKLARLERINNTYPVGEAKEGPQRPAPPSVVRIGPSSPKALESSARFILENYVRQRHFTSAASAPKKFSIFSDSGLFTPDRFCPFDSSAAAGGRRKTIGIAQLISLLDEDDRYRTLIVDSEVSQRSDLMSLAQEERNAVRGWLHKRMHMERLLYWRHEREQALNQEVTQLVEIPDTRHDPELDRCAHLWTEEEAARRAEIEADERDAAWQLQKVVDSFNSRLAVVNCEYEHRRGAEALFDKATATKIPMIEQLERVDRGAIEFTYDSFIFSQVNSDRCRNRLLMSVSSNPTAYAALRVLQCFFRRSLRGMVGWRYTNAKIGREVRSRRDEIKINRGRAALSDYRKTLENERLALEEEIQAAFIAQQQVITTEEAEERAKVLLHEEWLYTNRRTLLSHDIIAGCIFPAMKQCVVDEYEARHHIIADQHLEQMAHFQWCTTAAVAVKGLRAVVLKEERQRHRIVRREKHAFKQLVLDEYDGREDISLQNAAQIAELVVVRENFVIEAISTKHEVYSETLQLSEDWCRNEHARILYLMATDPQMMAVRLCREEEERRVIYEAYAIEQLLTVQAGALYQLQLAMMFGAVSDCIFGESLDRFNIFNEQTEAWREVQAVLTAATEEGYLLTRTSQDHAANLISSAYYRSKRQELGRTATQLYLREAFRPKQENRVLCAARARNLEVIRRAEAQLSFHLEEERRVARDRCQMTLDILEAKSEPRARASIADEYSMILTIIMRSFLYEGRIHGIDADNMVALLAQTEAYDRVQIMKEWRLRFEEVFEPGKASFRQDIAVRCIQRGWRCHAARAERRRRLAEALTRCLQEEQRRRVECELEELLAFALEVQWPGLQEGHDRYRLFDVAQPMVLQVEEYRGAIAAEGLRELANIFWCRAYEECDRFLCSEEAAARAELIARHFVLGEERVQFIDEESDERRVLENERTLFLLRFVVKEEAAHRTAHLDTYRASELDQLAHREGLAREAIAFEWLAFTQHEIFEPLHKLVAEHVIKATWWAGAQQLLCTQLEECERMGIAAQVPAAITRIFLEKEFAGRTLLCIAASFERQQVSLLRDEEESRCAIDVEWDRGVGYVPSSFAPRAINMKGNVYCHCTEGLEECVRECVEADWYEGLKHIQVGWTEDLDTGDGASDSAVAATVEGGVGPLPIV